MEVSSKLQRVFSELFELTYDSWKASGEPDHNTYLGGQKTFREMKLQHRGKVTKLERQAYEAIISATHP